MQISQIQSTIHRIEKFAYEKGTNVALYNVEHSSEYQAAKEKIRISIKEAIEYIAQYKDQIPFLMALAKAVNPTDELLSQVEILLASKTLSNGIDLGAYLVWAGSQGGQAALDKLGISGTFGITDPKLIEYFKDSANLTIVSVDKYTAKWIAQKIQEGKTNGLTPFEIAQSLKDESKGISELRAERIVLTETAKAMSTIELEASRRYGVTEKVWRTSLDDRVDEICVSLEGEQVPINSNFSGGYDGPPAHVSCRCYIEQIVPDTWEVPDNIWLGQ